MSRQNDPIERDGPEHPEPDSSPDPIPVPEDVPVPVPIEEPPGDDPAPIDEPVDRPILLVSAQELAQLRQCLCWG